VDSEPLVLHSAYRRSGGLIEVGLVERCGDLYVAHAMPARPKFLR